MGEFRFTPEQRERLAQFRVSPKQIEMLEGHACLVGRAWLRKSPPRTAVSNRITALGEHLRAAHVIAEEILAGNTPECRVAEGFLSEAVCRSGKEVELLDAARLEALARICDGALTILPKQTRHRDADPRPIQGIYEDLIRGHGTEHYILGDGDDRPATGTHPPPFTIKPSSSQGSQFRNIVSVCYEAMTDDPDADPERAIKAFIKQRKERMGHQVSEKDDLVS
jgi:hypothetical protein